MKRKVDKVVLRGLDKTLKLGDCLGPGLDLFRRGEHL
jgi:hypothetical protein